MLLDKSEYSSATCFLPVQKFLKIYILEIKKKKKTFNQILKCKQQLELKLNWNWIEIELKLNWNWNAKLMNWIKTKVFFFYKKKGPLMISIGKAESP